MIHSVFLSSTTTKSGARLSITTVSGRLNELSFTGEFVNEVAISWATSEENGLSSDEWRKEYVKGVATQHTIYKTPKLRMLQVGRGVSYTSDEILRDLQKIGLMTAQDLWEMVVSQSA